MKLYHYTDLNGLNGIVEHHSLWATNLYFLNDEEEMHHGLKAFENTLEHLKEDLSEKSIKILRDTLAGHRLFQARCNYNISFCQEPDLLSQWRGYGASQGVCLEFDKDELLEALDFGNATFFSGDVFYTKPDSTLEAKEEILTFLNNADFLKKKKSSVLHEFVGTAELINSLTPFFKHEGFRQESEFRIVIQQDIKSKAIKFRVNTHGLIPFIEIKAKSNTPYTGRLPLRGVKIGPCKNRCFVAEGIQFLLNSRGYKGIRHSFTETPFRA
ncbi:DUF2971 domain-containing protein [Symbiopectobacterium purcellii]|uniref:DUF2971 domain-containing protein n=1 Tax=Symbiopectobacterium purcellii TaxID=2871826 RepID=A0ABX9ATE0_9ENTR|nr:DUF2971 domain-containing protein [Symbiopectobacterium purcellii]QZN96714.1 DUF2971 domain-containing protein [Symbiopectobacterium purcellii]